MTFWLTVAEAFGGLKFILKEAGMCFTCTLQNTFILYSFPYDRKNLSQNHFKSCVPLQKDMWPVLITPTDRVDFNCQKTKCAV